MTRARTGLAIHGPYDGQIITGDGHTVRLPIPQDKLPSVFDGPGDPSATSMFKSHCEYRFVAGYSDRTDWIDFWVPCDREHINWKVVDIIRELTCSYMDRVATVARDTP